MDDLIRRKDALQAIAQLPLPYGVQRDKIITALYEVPAVETAPVVRCKDCKHWFKSDNGSWQMIGRTDGVCRMLMDIHYSESYMTENNHFCSYGERSGEL